MGILSDFGWWISGGDNFERKSDPVPPLIVPTHSPESIRAGIASGSFGCIDSLQLSAVYACARVTAEGLAQVPCLLQRDAKKGGRELAKDHPLYDLLASEPNSFQTSFELREWIGFRLAITGNAYVFVSRDAKGRPISLIPLAEGTVSVTNPTFGVVLYRLNVAGNPNYGPENIWHIKGPSWTGWEGLTFQAVAARAIGLSIDLENFGANLFANGSRPSGLLTTDQSLSVDQHAALAAAWNAENAGIANAHKTAILSAGLKFQQMQTTANDAQFIEARRFQIEEICRMMRVDPLMIQQAVGGAAYASVEQRFLAHMTHTIAPLYARFEQSAEKYLLSKDEKRKGYRVHLDNRSMMRGSAIDRANYYALMKQNGLMTSNEIRDFEGLDRALDVDSDKLTPSANLYGQAQPPLS